jgi:hypothetical protein
MGFEPCNCALNIWESIWDSNSHNGSSLGTVRVHSLTLFALLGAYDVTLRSPSWPATLQPLALVANPRLRLQHYIFFECFCHTFLKCWRSILHSKKHSPIYDKYCFVSIVLSYGNLMIPKISI